MPPGARKRRAARRKQQQQQNDQQQPQSEDSQPNSPHPQGNGHDLSSDQSDEDRMESNGNGVQKTASGDVFLDAADSPPVASPEDSSSKDDIAAALHFPPPGDSSTEDSPKEVSPKVSAAAEMEDSPEVSPAAEMEEVSPTAEVEDSLEVSPAVGMEDSPEVSAAVPVSYVDTVNEEVVQAMEDKEVVSESVADAIVVSVVEDNDGVSVPDEAVVAREVVVEEEKVPEKGGGVVEEVRGVGDEVSAVPLVRRRATIWNCCGLFDADA